MRLVKLKSVNIASVQLPDTMSLAQKASFYAATRQHEKALLYYESAVDTLNSDSLEWQQALNQYINILIRLKSNPHLCLDLLSKILDKNNSLSQSQTVKLLQWRQQIKAWISDEETTVKTTHL